MLNSLARECVCGDKGVSMRPATGLFVNNHLDLVPDFNMQAMEYFNTQADTLNFCDAQNALRHVNKWIERQTFHTIRDLFSPASFSQETSIILVNSLYFRGKWAKRFSIERTSLDDFWINDNQRMQVLMMRQVGQFRYGESRKLKSRILQLPFEDSDITMLFIVPFDINGLAELEMKLQDFDLNEVAMKSIMHDVDIMVPKFRVECDIDLKIPLHKLGVTRVFKRGSADLSGLFAKKSSELTTQARQKIYLNFNEAGCESDANAPFRPAKINKNPERKIFKANHPFVFAIRNSRNAYFVGHFIKP